MVDKSREKEVTWMGLFDKFKKNKTSINSEKKEGLPQNTTNKHETIYKINFKVSERITDQEKIEEIVKIMAAEDPFHRFYKGQKEADFSYISGKIYEYEEITTMNTVLIPKEESLQLIIENHFVGLLPDKISQSIHPYLDKNLLTMYVYVIGGNYKKYDQETGQVLMGSDPYDLEIHLQFD